MQEKVRAGAFGLLIILLSLSACSSSAQTDNSSKGGNQTQPTTKVETQNYNSRASVADVSPTPPPTKSENPFANLPAELAGKGKLAAESSDKCQLFSSKTIEKYRTKIRSYRIEFASGEKSVIIEDYAANRKFVNASGEQANSSIDESLVNEYILSAKAGQTVTLQVSPAQRKEVRSDVSGLTLEVFALEDCKNIDTIALSRKSDAEVYRRFRIKLPKSGNYFVLVTSQMTEETGYRLKIAIQ